VATKIVSALALNLSVRDRQSIAAEHTDNLEAYDCFLRGRELFWRHVRDANCEAEALLRRAADLDPGFAPARAFLAAALRRVDWSVGNVSRTTARAQSPAARGRREREAVETVVAWRSPAVDPPQVQGGSLWPAGIRRPSRGRQRW
jgi:hypothetical protein